MILGPDYKFILELNELVEEVRMRRKLRVLDEWFELVDKAGLDKLTPEIIDGLVSKAIMEDLE